MMVGQKNAKIIMQYYKRYEKPGSQVIFGSEYK